MSNEQIAEGIAEALKERERDFVENAEHVVLVSPDGRAGFAQIAPDYVVFSVVLVPGAFIADFPLN